MRWGIYLTYLQPFFTAWWESTICFGLWYLMSESVFANFSTLSVFNDKFLYINVFYSNYPAQIALFSETVQNRLSKEVLGDLYWWLQLHSNIRRKMFLDHAPHLVTYFIMWTWSAIWDGFFPLSCFFFQLDEGDNTNEVYFTLSTDLIFSPLVHWPFVFRYYSMVTSTSF